MSTLKVNKLRDTAGSADAITLDPNGGAVLAGVTTVTSVKVGAAVTISESGIEATGVGITVANINGGQISGRRNLIINGAMNVAQRGTSSTSSGFYTVDRFQLNFTGTNEAPTQAQVALSSGDTPYSSGFRYAYKVTNGDQTGGGGAAKFIRFKTTLEAQDIANSGWDYVSSSSFVTLSFWVKASVAQTYYGRVQTEDGTARNFPFSFALSENTWTKIVKIIPGNTSPTLQFDNNADAGLILEIVPYYGTDYTGSMSLNTWATYSDRTPDNTATWYETNDATFEITGVQLEVGSQATAFEHRSFGEELSLCRRYYYRETIQNAEYFNGLGKADSDGNSVDLNLRFPVRMRTNPSALEQTGDGNNYLIRGSSTLQCTGVPTYGDATQESATVRFTRSSHGVSTNNVANCGSWGGSYLGFSAEL